MKKIIQKALKKGADQAELFVIESKDQGVLFENGTLKKIEGSQSQGGALRVLRNGKLGFATTTDFDSEDSLIDQAIAASEFGSPFKFDFAPNAEFKELIPFDPQIETFDEEQMLNIGSQAISHMKAYDANILSSCSIGKSIQTISVVTSNGCEESYDRSYFGFSLSGQLVEPGNFLENYDGIEQTRIDFDLGSYLSSVIQPFRQGRKNISISSGKYQVILTPRALSGLFLALEQGLNGNNVAKGISPLKDKHSQKVLDERINLYADGTLKGTASYAPFDDEGTPSQKNILFQNGVLKNYLLDLQSAEKLNMYPSGNAMRRNRLYMNRDYLELPSPSINSWVMDGGARQFDEIFLDVKEAVLVDQIMGLLMSCQVNGDFSGTISLGYHVKDGQVTGRVKDCMIAGNIYDLLSEVHLQEISQDQRWILGAHGGTHMLPTLFLKDIFLSTK